MIPFTSSAACTQSLPGVAAIDFFVACQWMLPELDEQAFYLLLALSFHQRNGHSGLHIPAIADTVLWQDETLQSEGYLFGTRQQLLGLAGQLATASSGGLVLHKEMLFSARYFGFEQDVAKRLATLDRSITLTPEAEQRLQQAWQCLFPFQLQHTQEGKVTPDAQQVAVANAVGRGLVLLCGGPGTGKTYTAARMLSALLVSDPTLRIELAAPTGKAAQRLTESIAAAKQGLSQAGLDSHIVDAIPEQASTVHRMLGVRPDSLRLKHDADKPFDLDVLLIDEASMLDVAMMARILRAMPDNGRLILLGDIDQLPAVEAGNVLAELVVSEHPGFPEADAGRIAALSQQSVKINPESALGYLNLLTASRRFGGDIGRLAKAVIDGKSEQSWQLLQAGGATLTLLKQTQADWLEKLVKHYFMPVLNAASVEQAFVALLRFRMLTPMRSGETGVEGLNVKVEQLLARQHPQINQQRYYRGRPIMITENHYPSGLFNGDIGLIWPDSENRLKAWFEVSPGQYRAVNLARLPAHETVYAMTIHKTQGSEFADIALILPPNPHPLISRELLYTGITRAKQTVMVRTTEEVWSDAVTRRIQRYSALRSLFLQFRHATQKLA